MPALKGLDAELEALAAAAGLPAAEALPHLRKALAHRNNLVVSRAAKYAARLNLTLLTDDLAAAFLRFIPPADPAKTDPQCWAKHELARTLAAFEYQLPDIFLAGLHHHQLEPTWGGSSDTAGPLRGTCALALVQCRELASPVLLRHLTPLFADKDLPVRINAARAVEQVGSDSASLLLRLRAELASDEPELLGVCIGGVLRLDGEPALPWAAAFLTHQDDLAAETAFVLAEHRSPSAVPYLQQAVVTAHEPAFRNAAIAALVAMRLPASHAALLALLASRERFSSQIADALWAAQPSAELRQHLTQLGYKRPPA